MITPDVPHGLHIRKATGTFLRSLAAVAQLDRQLQEVEANEFYFHDHGPFSEHNLLDTPLEFCEYLIERYPGHHKWPEDPGLRAMFRLLMRQIYGFYHTPYMALALLTPPNKWLTGSTHGIVDYCFYPILKHLVSPVPPNWWQYVRECELAFDVDPDPKK